MTLDEFITLQRANLEKFRLAWAVGTWEYNWPTDLTSEKWERQYSDWAKAMPGDYYEDNEGG